MQFFSFFFFKLVAVRLKRSDMCWRLNHLLNCVLLRLWLSVFFCIFLHKYAYINISNHQLHLRRRITHVQSIQCIDLSKVPSKNAISRENIDGNTAASINLSTGNITFRTVCSKSQCLPTILWRVEIVSKNVDYPMILWCICSKRHILKRRTGGTARAKYTLLSENKTEWWWRWRWWCCCYCYYSLACIVYVIN